MSYAQFREPEGDPSERFPGSFDRPGVCGAVPKVVESFAQSLRAGHQARGSPTLLEDNRRFGSSRTKPEALISDLKFEI